MPPKAKKGEEAKKSKKDPTPLDDIDTTALTQEKLQEFCIRVQETLIKERQYSDFTRLDRDKLTDMVAISREQLIDLRNRVRIKVVELEDDEENHRIEMEQYHQQVINLAREKNIECLITRLETFRKVEHEGKCHEERMAEITSDIEALQIRRGGLYQHFHEQKQGLEIDLAERKSNYRKKGKEITVLEESRFERVFDKETTILIKLHENHKKELEARKNRETERLLKYKASVMNDLKHYFNKILHNNMSLIMVMKTSCQELKETSSQFDKQLSDLTIDNRSLKEAVESLRAEKERLRVTLTSATRDQSELLYTKREVKYRKEQLENLKWELEALYITEEKQREQLEENEREEKSQLLRVKGRLEELGVVFEHILNHLHLRMNEVDSILAIIRVVRRKQGKYDRQLESAPLLVDTSMDELNFRLCSVIEQRELVTRQYRRLMEDHHLHMEDTGFEPQDADDILKNARVLNVIIHEN